MNESSKGKTAAGEAIGGPVSAPLFSAPAGRGATIIPAVGDGHAFSLADFDRYVEEHGIPEDDYPAAFARWIAEKTGGSVPTFEKVEPPEDS